MEKNAVHNVDTYIFSIPAADEDALCSIRHMTNLTVAFDSDLIWIKGLSEAQASSSYLRQIPLIDLYELRDGFLFKKGKLVPERKMPLGLLWNSLQRTFPVTLGEVNHNFFGVMQTVEVRIVESAAEQTAAALLTDINTAELYITRSAAARLHPLRWCLFENKAFITGTPLLSIPGTAYWHSNGSYLPAGYDFEYPLLARSIHRRLDPENNNNIIWFTDSSYLLLPVKNLVALSISSFRLSKH